MDPKSPIRCYAVCGITGDPSPSSADVQVTRQLREVARAVDIEFMDHVVLGEKINEPQGRGYYSFREAGLL